MPQYFAPTFTRGSWRDSKKWDLRVAGGQPPAGKDEQDGTGEKDSLKGVIVGCLCESGCGDQQPGKNTAAEAQQMSTQVGSFPFGAEKGEQAKACAQGENNPHRRKFVLFQLQAGEHADGGKDRGGKAN